MYGKVIIFTLLLAFLAYQMVQAKDTSLIPPRSGDKHLKNTIVCQTCYDVRQCKSPQTLICDQNSANLTNHMLAMNFMNVVNITGQEFECLKTTYSYKNSTVIDIRGCINVGVNACGLVAKNTTLQKNNCKTCKKDLCNPAGTFSSSSFAMMLSSIFVLVSLKSLHF
ncbi:hypothetical protein FF38_13244 [Lucilia cuprina]|uniref:Protein sleepless n=1 Tax=Lucilia cuprina TaxID=7375 RepID=A0A0L0CLZ5_LUCCU|nr:hypothetical protein CVS40_12569 [Lucilia cuprina]KNC33262.1 hypothetical protein FF38_13244 [Lucilia cuprina]